MSLYTHIRTTSSHDRILNSKDKYFRVYLHKGKTQISKATYADYLIHIFVVDNYSGNYVQTHNFNRQLYEQIANTDYHVPNYDKLTKAWNKRRKYAKYRVYAVVSKDMLDKM